MDYTSILEQQKRWLNMPNKDALQTMANQRNKREKNYYAARPNSWLIIQR